MATFYQVVFNGSYQGKDNRCSLYYRTAIDLGEAFGFGGAAELAEEVNQEIVPSWLGLKPNGYVLDSIDVYPRNNAFELLYQLPYKLPVQQHGAMGGWNGQMDSPGLCMNIRFNLEPRLIGLQAVTAPKRGYIAVGPLPSTWLGDDGQLTGTLLENPTSEVNALCAAISQNLESIDPPAIWYPIRVAQHYGGVGAGNISWGWADVRGAVCDKYVSFRRSRRITG